MHETMNKVMGYVTLARKSDGHEVIVDLSAITRDDFVTYPEQEKYSRDEWRIVPVILTNPRVEYGKDA